MKELNGRFNMSSLDVDESYITLIDTLGYRNDQSFSDDLGQDALYDAEYAIVVDGMRYPLVGIKKHYIIDEAEIAKLHLKYWNSNDIPFSILVLPNEIRIYNNFTIKESKLLYSSIRDRNTCDLSDFCSDVLIFNLTNSKLENCIKKTERVDQQLLESLRSTILTLCEKHHMDIKVAYGFFAQCIFVKYLEDRGIINLSADVFACIAHSNFTELLGAHNFEAIAQLFRMLKDRFQGDFFDLTEPILPDQLEIIARFFAGEHFDIEGHSQMSLFAYDFSIIPIELISNIYETFFALDDQINKTTRARGDGAYYTPYYLADFMVKTCFERIGKTQPTVLDPACGSGVFLVSSYRRMVEELRKSKKEICAEDLTELLKNHIYGVDKNREALNIACFSLYIAMLDYLEPKDIYENQVYLPILKNNLIADNFVKEDAIPALQGVAVDLVIGNPPWTSAKQDVIEKHASRNNGVSDQQTAQLFVIMTKRYSHASTLVSFLVPNSIFLNEKATVFRSRLFNDFTVLEVLNLHGIRNGLFKNAKAPCSILTLQSFPASNDYKFSYFAFRPNLLSLLLNKIVYDKEDIIGLKKSAVLQNEQTWYILTNGDQFDLQVIAYMFEYPKLKQLMRSYRLECGRGYAIGGGEKKHCPDFLAYRGGNLEGHFESYLIDEDGLPFITEEYYERPRKLSFYQHSNKLLIKRTSNKRTGRASSSGSVFIFSDDFYQLADTTEKNFDLIFYLEALYNSRLFEYYCYHCTKSEVSIKPEITKENLLGFPIPPFDCEDKTIHALVNLVKKIKETKKLRMQKKAEWFSLEPQKLQEKLDALLCQIDQQVLNLYGFSAIEREIINRTLDADFHGVEADDKDIDRYQKRLCGLLNDLLSDSGYVVTSTPPRFKRFFGVAVFNVKKEGLENNIAQEDEIIKKVTDFLGLATLEQLEGSVIVKRRISGFMEDGFYFIKTKDKKNWTTMSAIQDANFIAQHAITNHEGRENNG